MKKKSTKKTVKMFLKRRYDWTARRGEEGPCPKNLIFDLGGDERSIKSQYLMDH